MLMNTSETKAERITEKSFFKSKRNVALLAIFYTFLWGTAFPLVKLCMDGFGISDNMSKCLVAGIRFFISGGALLVYCAKKEPSGIALSKTEAKYVLLYGILATAIQYSLTYIGLSRVDGSKGAVFDQLCVFMIIIAGGLFFKDDRLTVKKVLGCVSGFVGMVAINVEGIGFSFSLGGEGVMILAAVCQAVAYFVAKAASDKVTAAKLVGYGQFIGGGVLIVFALLAGGRIEALTSVGVITLVALAAISAVAYVLSLIPLKYFPASEISVFNLLITVFGIVMSAAVLGENVLRLNYLVSLALVSLGIVLVNKK